MIAAESNNDNYNYNSKTSGRWSKKEHQKFIEGLTKYGKNWKKIEDHIGTRNGPQIRSHAQKFFLKLLKEYKKDGEDNEQYNELIKNFNILEEGNGTRIRSNSAISNFSFEEETVKDNEISFSFIKKNSNLNNSINMSESSEKKEGNNDIDVENGNKSEEKQEKPINVNSLMKLKIDIELFISKLMKKKEDFELLYQDENVKKDVIDQEILHLEKITNFFFAYVCCLELVLQPFSNVTPENLNLNEKENSSFFYMLIKCLELSNEDFKNIESTNKFRKLSDFVLMTCEEENYNQKENEHIYLEKKPMRKNSFKICNEIENEEKKLKLENLRRKNSLNDTIDKKSKNN